MNNGLAQKAAANAVQRQEGEGKAPSIPSLLNARWLAEQLQRQMGGTPEEAQSFVRSVITATKAAPDLLRCDPETIYGGMFAAAQLGLPIGGGLKQAYLIPRKDRNSPTGWSASFQVGYPGLIKLAANSGLVVGVDTIRVMKGDRFRQGATSERGKFFDLSFGDDHDSTDDNDIVGVIGMVYQLNRKEPRWVYMSRRQVERRRPDFTKEQTGQNGPYIPNTPWKTDWGAMAEKTVVIEALKFAPKSEKLQLAVTMDMLRRANRQYWLGFALHHTRIYSALIATFAISAGLASWVGALSVEMWAHVGLSEAWQVIGAIVIGMVIFVMAWSLLLFLTRRVYE
jgi:recombination protein RecT